MTNPTEPDEPLEPELVDAADADGGFGGLGSLLEQAQQMQQQLLEAQAEIAQTVVEGQAGGGVVRVEVTGGFEFQAVHIDRDVVDTDDVEMLEDLVLAALHDAAARLAELQQQSLGAGMPGLDGLGDLGGLFGGGDEAAPA